DSAGGSAKQARDRRFQAVLPLKGKILNVQKARLVKILENDEINTIITAIGGGFDESFDISKARYGKIILMADADVDGSHIRTLLLTLFFRYMRELIYEGRLYIAQPPLYKIAHGKQEFYAYSDQERDAILERLRADGARVESITVTRFKGLGEMNPEQLWMTTMNPETRTLLQVTIENAAEATRTFDMLMGDKVEPRREFIERNALFVKHLDV
ncbi:MAG: toprim domain-containing protein, partial [Candidatus Kapabacteria bacterium]|nr:toprim domain-containing protein [Candidatus Kapabacteria bacterium]MDW7997408.1 toprim domain-containing protein [Bacteroidota bacterium]